MKNAQGRNGKRARKRLLPSLVAGIVVAIGGAAPASAHLVSTGLGPFYDGLGHLALTPEDLMTVLALALIAGQRGKEHGRAALLILPAAWTVGGLLGLLAAPVEAPALGVASMLLLGALVVLDRDASNRLTIGLAAGVGLLHGFLNGGAFASSSNGSLAILGIASAVFTLVALIAAFVVRLKMPWTRVAVRVIGSWILAIGLLMVGWWSQGAL